MSIEAALDELVRCSGSQFDPDVVAPLVALIRAGFDASASAERPSRSIASPSPTAEAGSQRAAAPPLAAIEASARG